MNNTQLSLETGKYEQGVESRRILPLIATSSAEDKEEGGILGTLLPPKSARVLQVSSVRAGFQIGLKIIYLEKSMATGLGKQNFTEA